MLFCDLYFFAGTATHLYAEVRKTSFLHNTDILLPKVTYGLSKMAFFFNFLAAKKNPRDLRKIEAIIQFVLEACIE